MMATAWQFRRALIALGATTLLCGCLAVPYPSPGGYEFDSRQNVPATVPASWVVGSTHFEQMLLQFGQPDWLAPDETLMIYHSRRAVTGIGLVGIGNAAAQGSWHRIQVRDLVITFDTQGVLTSARVELSTCSTERSRELLSVHAGWVGPLDIREKPGCKTIEDFAIVAPQKGGAP